MTETTLTDVARLDELAAALGRVYGNGGVFTAALVCHEIVGALLSRIDVDIPRRCLLKALLDHEVVMFEGLSAEVVDALLQLTAQHTLAIGAGWRLTPRSHERWQVTAPGGSYQTLPHSEGDVLAS